MPEDQKKADEVPLEAGIIKIAPQIPEKLLFERLNINIERDANVLSILERLKDVVEGPERVYTIVHILLKQPLSSPLGYIIPPNAGSGILKDRMVQVSSILINFLSDMVKSFENEIMAAIQEGKNYEVEAKTRELIQYHIDAMIAAREAINRLFILYTINLPAKYRPPLANVKFGLDML